MWGRLNPLIPNQKPFLNWSDLLSMIKNESYLLKTLKQAFHPFSPRKLNKCMLFFLLVCVAALKLNLFIFLRVIEFSLLNLYFFLKILFDQQT